MDLKSYLSQQKEIHVFDVTSDNQDVLSLLGAAPMHIGGIDLLYDRKPDFSKLLECQSPLYKTFLGRRGEKINGFFSMSFQKKWIQGQKVSCAYIGDFRTDNSRSVARLWRQSYGEILKLVQQDNECGKPQYFLTGILKKNVEALRNLTSSKRDLGFYYEPLVELEMVNVYGRMPWCRRSRLIAERATRQDLETLKSFLNAAEQRKNFGTIFDNSEDDCWPLREKSWEGFSIENFLVIRNTQRQIVACTLPWNPGFAKRMVVVKAPFLLRKAFQVLRLFGLNMPDVGDSLNTIYLTHLNFNNALDQGQVVKAFVEEVFNSNKTVHMVSFVDECRFSKKIIGWIQQRFSVQLFSVSVNRTKKMVSHDKISFEMGLV